MIFKDRHDAGTRLAESLKRFSRESTVVFAIPPGGIVPASVVATALNAPLNLVVIRRILHPRNSQTLLAVVSEHGHTVTSGAPIDSLEVGWLGLAIREQEQEARRLRQTYGEDTAPVRGRTAIIVDDGMITGLTMSLAVQEVRRLEPERIVVAVPAATTAAIERIRPVADATATILEIADGVGILASSYAQFKPVSDRVVAKAMQASYAAQGVSR